MKLFIAMFFISSIGHALSSKTQDPCQILKIKQQEISVIASNIANVNTTRTEDGGPYKHKVLKCKNGDCNVVAESKTVKKYMPEHPDANIDGYVFFPKIDVRAEMQAMMNASAAYDKARIKCE